MFTPGFKLFAGFSAVGIIGALIYGLSSGTVDGHEYFGFVDRERLVGLISLGWKGNIGAGSGVMVLLAMGVAGALLGGTAVAFRDADVESVAELGDTPSIMPLAQRPTVPNWWPAATAVGAGVLMIGLVMDTNAFWIIGLAILAVAAVEWALSDWADRSTADARTNAALRDRVGASMEIPVVSLAIAGAFALAVSRMLLWATGNLAVVIAGVASVIILAVALLGVFRPQIGRKTMGSIVGLVAVATIVLGIVTTVIEPRHAEGHSDDHSGESYESSADE